jgi:hypothetical protein
VAVKGFRLTNTDRRQTVKKSLGIIRKNELKKHMKKDEKKV